MSATTAQLREQARQAEARCDFAAAAALFDQAAQAYPANRLGDLQAADIASLRRRAEQCRNTLDEVEA